MCVIQIRIAGDNRIARARQRTAKRLGQDDRTGRGLGQLRAQLVPVQKGDVGFSGRADRPQALNDRLPIPDEFAAESGRNLLKREAIHKDARRRHSRLAHLPD